MTRLAVALALIVILAGCAGGAVNTTSTTTSTTTPTTVTPTTTTSIATTRTATTTSTPATTTTTEETRYHNPWQKETITVGVTNDANDRSITPLVREALDYWETHSSEYATYEANYEIVPVSEQPDILVRFVPTVDTCGSHDTSEPLGCAPILRQDDTPLQPEIIEIRAGYTNASTLDTIKHEFGHTLGLTHDDEPQPLMAAYGSVDRLPVRNASELEYPRRTTNITVYAVAGDGWTQTEATRETDKLMQFYNGGADGWMTTRINLTYADSREEADVVIEYNTSKDCGYDYGGVCGSVYGYDIDGDGAFEYYTGDYVIVTDVDRDMGGWFAAYSLAYSLGAEAHGTVPEPLEVQRNADDDWYN